MRDIPVFTTENGAASLILSQIPYRRTAYIVLQASTEPEKLLADCVSVCKMAGAEKVLARGSGIPASYPVETRLICMKCKSWRAEPTDAQCIPVTPETAGRWLELFHMRMKNTPLAAYMTVRDSQMQNACFVEDSGRLIGLGVLSGTTVSAVVSLEKGAGERVLRALCKDLAGAELTLEVADTNLPAVRLYTRCGFVQTEELACWHRIV